MAGAEIVCIPQAGGIGEWPEGMYEAEVRTASFQNGYFTALCNRVGAEEKVTFAGESFISSPEGIVLARGATLEDDLVIADLDLTACARSTARTLFWKDRRPELYGAWLTENTEHENAMMTDMRSRGLTVLLVASTLITLGCGRADTDDVADSGDAPPESPLPDPSGWGTQVLAVAQAPDGAVWVGTYGDGIYVSRDGTGTDWEHIASSDDSTSISWDFVNSFAFAPGEVWYGTIGNGWGLSRDGGATWENWTFRKLGPRWQYVVPDGIRTAGDTAYIATADGLRITSTTASPTAT